MRTIESIKNILYSNYLLPADFNWRQYLELNKDLREAGINNRRKAIKHYITHGDKEGRVYRRLKEEKHHYDKIRKKQLFNNRLFKIPLFKRLLFQLFKNDSYYRSKNINISVVITCYNYDKYILRCLKSVVNNKIDNKEIIIINDNSSDDSLNIIIKFCQKSDIPCLVINKSVNSGASHSRNLGLKYARGKYVFILDADNEIYANCLKEHYNFIKKSDYIGVYGIIECFDENNKLVRNISNKEFNIEVLKKGNYIDTMAIFNKEKLLSLGGYDIDLLSQGIGLEDYELWLRIHQNGFKVGFINKPLSRYFIKENSISYITNKYYYKKLYDYLGKKFKFRTFNKIFQIGFNKCGTTSINQFFIDNNLLSIHWSNGQLAEKINENFKANKRLLAGYEEYDCFTDMENLKPGVDKDSYYVYCKYFKELDKQYPNSIFILNQRDIDTWINSRKNHDKGDYLRLYKKCFNLRTDDEVFKKWRKDWYQHEKNVKEYFKDRPDDLLIFDIKKERKKFIKFMSQIIEIKKYNFKQENKTIKGNYFLEIRGLFKYYLPHFKNSPSLIPRAIRFLFKNGFKKGFSKAVKLSKKEIVIDNNFLKYDQYIKNKENNIDEKEIEKRITEIKIKKKISLIVPLYEVDYQGIARTIQSFSNQLYQEWELYLITMAEDLELNKFTQKDKRIKVLYSHSESTMIDKLNSALGLIEGDFFAFMDSGDVLNKFALLLLVENIANNKVDIIYTDEDIIDEEYNHSYPLFKPDWSPDLILSKNYINNLCLYRKEKFKSLRLRAEFEGAQDWDFLLRASEISNNIYHIPEVLYHQNRDKNIYTFNNVFRANRSLLLETIKRRNIPAYLQDNIYPPYYIRYSIINNPLVSIIIPNKNKLDLLQDCLDTILERTNYLNYEIIIIDNNSDDFNVKKYYNLLASTHQDKIKILDYKKEFNYSAINNQAVKFAQGDLLLFLNNDIKIINNDWLKALVEQASRPEVGVVGAKLLYPDNKIQHAGVVFTNKGDSLPHAFAHYNNNEKYYTNTSNSIRNYNAVTGACLMMRKEVFEKIGGFDERLKVSYNDIDLCFKTRSLGYLVVYTPLALLYHLESATRGKKIYPKEQNLFKEKWKEILDKPDEYYNVNLSSLPNETFTWDENDYS